jgi:hypothetical protein
MTKVPYRRGRHSPLLWVSRSLSSPEAFLLPRKDTSPGTLKKYLVIGEMRGIGPAMAKRIVTAFGEGTFGIIEASPERLTEVGAHLRSSRGGPSRRPSGRS